MKKSMFFVGAMIAAGLSFTACSSDNDAVQEETSLNSKFDAQGNAYVNIAINLPTTRGTRANEVYDNGLASEYDVKDAVLVVYEAPKVSDDYV